MSDNYIYTFYGDGTTTWIYRCSESGDIVRAKSTDTHYSYFDLSEMPKRVICEFRDASKRKWSMDPYPEPELSTQEIPTNDDDTGITDEEFKELVLSRYANVIFEDSKFKMLVEHQDRSKSYLDMPLSLLKSIAKKNRYFGNAIWMVD